MKGCSPTPWAHRVGGQGTGRHPQPALNHGAHHSLPYKYRTIQPPPVTAAPPEFPLGLQRSWEEKPRFPEVTVLALTQLRLPQ